jgi:hypothetical protein
MIVVSYVVQKTGMCVLIKLLYIYTTQSYILLYIYIMHVVSKINVNRYSYNIHYQMNKVVCKILYYTIYIILSIIDDQHKHRHQCQSQWHNQRQQHLPQPHWHLPQPHWRWHWHWHWQRSGSPG